MISPCDLKELLELAVIITSGYLNIEADVAESNNLLDKIVGSSA